MGQIDSLHIWKGYSKRITIDLVWVQMNEIFKVKWCPRQIVKIKSLVYDSKIGLDTESISFYLTIESSCGCDMLLIGWLRIFSTVGLNKKVYIQKLFKYE